MILSSMRFKRWYFDDIYSTVKDDDDDGWWPLTLTWRLYSTVKWCFRSLRWMTLQNYPADNFFFLYFDYPFCCCLYPNAWNKIKYGIGLTLRLRHSEILLNLYLISFLLKIHVLRMIEMKRRVEFLRKLIEVKR